MEGGAGDQRGKKHRGGTRSKKERVTAPAASVLKRKKSGRFARSFCVQFRKKQNPNHFLVTK